MKHVFWLADGQLCGRPGPNHEPWTAAELKVAGVGAVLSVNNGDLVHPEDFAALDMPYQCTPLASSAPPRPGDLELCLERLPIAFDFASRNIEASRAVMVHCRQGKDRTGLFMAYFLCRTSEASPEEAVARVREARPIAFTADGWDTFPLYVLNACKWRPMAHV